MILILSNFFYLNVKGLDLFWIYLFKQINIFQKANIISLCLQHTREREKRLLDPRTRRCSFFFPPPVVWLWRRNVQSAIGTGRCTTFVCKTDLIIPTIGVGWPKMFGTVTVSGLPVESSVYLARTEQAVASLSWDPGSLKQGNSCHVLIIAFWQ